MQHKTLAELREVAAIHPDKTRPAMTRSEKLSRWAELLERDPERLLGTLAGTEYQPAEARETMRATDTPLSVAFSDPVLRTEGLGDDSYGEAKRFFELADWQLHDIVCYCHYGASVGAGAAARHVRAAIGGPREPRFFSALRQALVR